MKITLFAVAVSALAGLCAAQSPQAALPECAQKCVVKFTSGDSIGGCQSQAAACICSSPSFLGDIACCLAKDCGAADQKKATDFARDYCELSGVTNLPSAVVCSSTTAPGTTSPPTSAPTHITDSSNSTTITSAPTVGGAGASQTTSAPATSSTPNAGSQNAAGVGAGFGMLALAALL